MQLGTGLNANNPNRGPKALMSHHTYVIVCPGIEGPECAMWFLTAFGVGAFRKTLPGRRALRLELG